MKIIIKKYQKEDKMNTAIKNNKASAKTIEIAIVKGNEISKIGIGVLSVTSGIIGIWGFACAVGGLIEAGGPVSLFKGWLSALAGM
jgi:hypothetical protein